MIFYESGRFLWGDFIVRERTFFPLSPKSILETIFLLLSLKIISFDFTDDEKNGSNNLFRQLSFIFLICSRRRYVEKKCFFSTIFSNLHHPYSIGSKVKTTSFIRSFSECLFWLSNSCKSRGQKLVFNLNFCRFKIKCIFNWAKNFLIDSLLMWMVLKRIIDEP